jgi:hypothetical protein
MVISAVVTFLLTWVYKLTINYPKYKELNERQKVLRQEIKKTKDIDDNIFNNNLYPEIDKLYNILINNDNFISSFAKSLSYSSSL